MAQNARPSSQLLLKFVISIFCSKKKKKKKAQNEAAAEQFSLQAVEGSSSDLIALGPTLAPEEQRVPPWATVAPQQRTETILRSEKTPVTGFSII